MNYIIGFFPVLQDKVNAATMEITQVLEQKQATERENNELQIRISDQHKEIATLNTSLQEQTKVTISCTY